MLTRTLPGEGFVGVIENNLVASAAHFRKLPDKVASVVDGDGKSFGGR